MSSAGVQSRQGGGQPGGLVLEVELVPGRELRGSIRLAGEPRSVLFHGWIDFMAAVCVLRDAAADPDR